MAEKDEKLAEKPAETEELVPVEDSPAKPEDEAAKPEDDAKPADDAAVDDDDDGEDERLGHSEDDSKESAAKRNRQRRNEARKRHQARLEAEVETLKAQNIQFQEKLARVEFGHTTNALSTLEERIAKAKHDSEQALAIHAKAIDAQNGEDAALALRIREEALEELRLLTNQHTELRRVVETPAQQPQVDQQLLRHAGEWITANKEWYDPRGGNEASVIANKIDKDLVAEGYDPRTKLHWDELTRRLNDVFTAANKQQSQTSDKGGRKGPPTGAQREGNGGTLKANEIYVAPERKQAMIEAGIWDDPVRRQRALQEYKRFDAEHQTR